VGAFARELRPIAPVLALGAIVGPLALRRLAARDPQAAAVLVLPLAASVVINVVVPLRAWQGEGVHPRYLILGLPVGYLCLTEALDWLLGRARVVATASVAVVAALSLVAVARAYPLPKQGYRQALAWIAAHRAPGEDRIGIAAGGRAARFWDPSLVVVRNDHDLAAWLPRATGPTWLLFTFPDELARKEPALHQWIRTATEPRASFPGTIGDGDVRVHLWRPPAEP
jgi:hypothetical protein